MKNLKSILECDTTSYAVPSAPIEPAPGDTGFAMVKKAFKKPDPLGTKGFHRPNPTKKKKRMKNLKGLNEFAEEVLFEGSHGLVMVETLDGECYNTTGLITFSNGYVHVDAIRKGPVKLPVSNIKQIYG